MVAAGLGLVGACGGGGGGGGDGLPRSQAAYAGSSMPAFMDSTTAWEYDYFFEQIDNAVNYFQGGIGIPLAEGPWSNTDTFNGSISGTYIEEASGNSSSSSTLNVSEAKYKGTYSNYADSGDTLDGVLAGSGSWEFRYRETGLYDGIPTPQEVGTWLSGTYMEHTNYSAFMESTDSSKESYSGYMSGNDTDDPDGFWTTNQAANIAYNNLASEYYVGLLNFSGNAAWDGSESTYVASGTLCAEGGPEVNLNGCVEFELDLMWDWDIDECWLCEYPDGGTVTLSTVDATVMYDYSYTSSGGCFLYSVDADNNSAYEYTSVECEVF